MAGSKVISQVEVLSASDAGRRRGWTDDDKVRIVEESLRGVRQAAATARRHGISRSLLTRWRREFREGLLRAEGQLGFTPLQIAPDAPPPVREEACRSQAGQDCIEVVLTNGRRLVIEASVDLAMLARLHYIYDFGDNWEHEVRVERLTEPEPGTTYPRLLKAQGRCPPEDVGGPWGYDHFLEVMADPGHEEHAELLDWHGGPFDPQDAEPERITQDFAKLAKRWAAKPRKPAPPS